MKIATFNVNSIRSRIQNLADWAKEKKPNIILLQELKCQDDEFAKLNLQDIGYHAVSFGQKSYNGVAILSDEPITDVTKGFGDDDEQARFISGETHGICVASLYCPNGNPVDSEKFSYKLAWMEKLETFVKQHVLRDERVWVLGGDYNICPDDRAVWDISVMAGDALCQAESVACYRRLVNLGLVDAWRSLHPLEEAYSFWDYQGGAYSKNHGLLIDFLMLSPQAADRLVGAEIDGGPRGKEKPSDHTPVVCELA